jgi:hypothetical protein
MDSKFENTNSMENYSFQENIINIIEGIENNSSLDEIVTDMNLALFSELS